MKVKELIKILKCTEFSRYSTYYNCVATEDIASIIFIFEQDNDEKSIYFEKILTDQELLEKEIYKIQKIDLARYRPELKLILK